FRILQDPNHPSFRVQALTPPQEITVDRLSGRRELLDTVNRQGERLAAAPSVSGMNTQYEKAFNLISSSQTQKAFDLKAEPDSVRDRYGRHKFGQGVLLSRRLVEQGVPLVTVYWNGEQEVPGGWDLHYESYPRLKKLMPPLDKAFSALL